jgi:acyl carrier protein
MDKKKLDELNKILNSQINTGNKVQIDKTFEENDIDSLDKFLIISYIEKKKKIKITDKVFLKIKKPKDLIKYL